MSFSHCAQKLVRYNTSMDFTPQNNLPQTHHVLRFVFAAIAALVVIVLGYWLYQNKFSSQIKSTESSNQKNIPFPVAVPVSDEDQKFINDKLLKMSNNQKQKTDAEIQAEYEVNGKALPVPQQ